MHRRTFLAVASGAAAYQFILPSDALASPAPQQGQDGGTESVIAPVRFDLAFVPFSRAGSFLSSELVSDSEGRRVRFTTDRRSAIPYRTQSGAWADELFDLWLVRGGSRVFYEVDATSERLLLRGEACEASIAFAGVDRLILTVRGASLLLRFARALTWKIVRAPEQITALDYDSGYTFDCRAAEGSSLHYVAAELTQPSAKDSVVLSGDVASARANIGFSVEREERLVDVSATRTEPNCDAWMRHCPRDENPATAHATRVAWYLFWALRVAPAGGYTRPSILSSRRSLSQIWSWDNLFNALAVVSADPVLAWQQLRVLLDHQLPSGVLPDAISDLGPVYNFRKPPVWAWAARRLLSDTLVSQQEPMLRAVYPGIARFHRWWFRERDLRRNGIPAYLHGNDSGWDNASVFAERWPVESPDLLALLCLDAECLAALAKRQGLYSEAAAWREESEQLLTRFHHHFVRGDRLIFYVLRPGGAVEQTSTSLLTRLPILLGERLQPAIRATLVRELKDPALFAAASGPASESLSSPLYDPDGYWRGPVWGPSTLLICEGLWRSGERGLARDFAQRYRAVVARKADFRENYDARSGEGRYDSGMTWSAADYLLLAKFYLGDADHFPA